MLSDHCNQPPYRSTTKIGAIVHGVYLDVKFSTKVLIILTNEAATGDTTAMENHYENSDDVYEAPVKYRQCPRNNSRSTSR